MKKTIITATTLLTACAAGKIVQKQMNKKQINPMITYATCYIVGRTIGLIGRAIMKGGDK